MSVGLVGVSSPQLTDRARAAINMCTRIVFSGEVAIVLARQNGARTGSRAQQSKDQSTIGRIFVTIR